MTGNQSGETHQALASIIGGGLTVLRDPQFDRATDRLYYLRVAPSDSLESTHGTLWSCDREGADQRQVSLPSANVVSFRVFQGGGQIAVVDTSAEAPRMLVLTSDDHSLVLDVALPSLPTGRPAWSRAGQLIALSILKLSTEPSPADQAIARAYKEDGTGFIGDARRQIWILDIQTSTWQQVTHGSVHCTDPEWSPTEDVVAFRTQDPLTWPMAGVAEVSCGSEAVAVHATPAMSLDAFVWSPDGERLLLVGDDELPWVNHGDLFILRRHDGHLSRLTQGITWQPWVQGFHLSPSATRWSADDVLLVPAVQRGHSILVQIELASRRQRVVASWADVRGGSAWIDDLLVQERSSLESVGELVAHCLTTNSDKTIAAPNAKLLEPLAKPRVVRTTVPRDDVDIDVWVLIPAGTDATRCPLVLDVHGGPHNFYGELFIPEQQALLAAGIAVAFANPRGSASYGRAFGAGTHAAWGLDDTEDLWASMQFAASLPEVDESAVGIMGWSYGGYQVAWMLARSDRFAAAACGAPAFDLASWVGTSDLGSSFASHEVGGRPHEVPDRYHMQSPASHAHRIQTPTLILHGADDLRSPIGQTEMMFDILTNGGCRVEYRRYPGASHAFRHTGSPRQRADVIERIVRWFVDELAEAQEDRRE